VNAAYALRIEDRVGSLDAGKDGDLIVLGCGDYREIPFRFGMNPVAMVLRRGEPIFPRMGPS
jgi:imidazolonepropionase